jgi:hypothetical protein
MPDYHVNWEIELSADSPREAAAKALAIQRDPDSIATVFEVRDESGHTERIDLDQSDDDETCTACGRAFEEDESIIQAPTGRNYCRDCFDQGKG